MDSDSDDDLFGDIGGCGGRTMSNHSSASSAHSDEVKAEWAKIPGLVDTNDSSSSDSDTYTGNSAVKNRPAKRGKTQTTPSAAEEEDEDEDEDEEDDEPRTKLPKRGGKAGAKGKKETPSATKAKGAKAKTSATKATPAKATPAKAKKAERGKRRTVGSSQSDDGDAGGDADGDSDFEDSKPSAKKQKRGEEAEPSASQEEKKTLKPFAPKHREETRLDMFVLVKRAHPYARSTPIWWPARKIDDATELRAAAQASSCGVGFSDIVSGVGEEVVVQFIDGRAEANLVQKKMDTKTMVQPFYLQVTNENPKC